MSWDFKVSGSVSKTNLKYRPPDSKSTVLKMSSLVISSMMENKVMHNLEQKLN